MAYIALYRKWRPKNFEDVVGQSHITETLQKAIDTDKVAHAYLFSGPRGTGKTSTAKIFARAMNCVHGPTSHPCNECEVCRHILQGESMDVVEIDAASNRSIEDIRTLRETIKFMPAEGHKKIYIIDEVHMLTTEAFNALLKTLEEPPAHVIFILATTEPERIPMTILSRCQRYEFRRITSQDIVKRLLYVADQEHIDLTKGAAHILAVQADGGMRDALSMLDQCVSNTEGTIDEKLVRDLLGLIGRDWLFSLTDAVFAGKGAVIIKAVDDVVRMGKEPQVLLTEVLEHLRAIMLYQADSQTDTLAAYADSMNELAAQAKKMTPERVFAILNVLQQALLSAKNSPVPRVAVEMGLLMASRTQDAGQPTLTGQAASAVPEDVLDRLTRLEQIVFPNGSTAAKPKAQEYIPIPEEEEGAAGFAEEAIPFPDEEYTASPSPVGPEVQRPSAVPKVNRRKSSDSVASHTAVKTSTSASSAAPVSSSPAKAVHAAAYQTIWQQMCAILDKEKKKAVLSCIRNGRVVYIGEGRVIVAFKTAFMVKRANREDYFKFVDAALSSILEGTVHMTGYLEGDEELAAYEKKNNKQGINNQPAVSQPDVSKIVEKREEMPAANRSPQEKVENEAASRRASEKPLSPAPPASQEPKLKPATVEDMSQEERALLEPLLKTVGDCNIYIEDKK